MNKTTVVTAYYPLSKSKHTIPEYIDWASNFFSAVTSPTICYTTPVFEQIFNRFVKDNKVIFDTSKTLEEWNISKQHDWRKQYDLDPERYHSPELYMAWALKQEAVMQTIQSNPFDSTHFVWCDIGCFRDKNGPSDFATIPPEFKKLSEFFICLNIYGTIGGGVLVGDKGGWAEFSKLYNEELNIMKQEGLFIGKDQSVFLRIVSKMKTNIKIIQPRFFDDWFCLIDLFSTNKGKSSEVKEPPQRKKFVWLR